MFDRTVAVAVGEEAGALADAVIKDSGNEAIGYFKIRFALNHNTHRRVRPRLLNAATYPHWQRTKDPMLPICDW